MKQILNIFFIITSLSLGSCGGTELVKENISQKIQLLSSAVAAKQPVVIEIIPYDDMPVGLTDYVYKHFKKIYSNTKLKRPIPLPHSAYYAARNRYKGDTLLRYLAAHTPKGHVSLALTTKDISTTKGNFADYGIMGLSYCPGKACVASNYRLKNKEQFFKVAIHELGHTQGIPHCPVKNCFMRDAKGGNHTNEEKEFCPTCRKVLIKAGWIL